MSDLIKPLIVTLTQGATTLREARLPGEIAAALERLAGQVDQPCVLAVVGRMKAGKSTFINALLGEDVAKTGVTETTATINRIQYGTPANPERPVRCYWRGGRYEDVSRAFLDSLQGNTVEVLRQAGGIEYLEYLLPNPYLREVTLVDTPGTAAVVDEHQNRTAEFLNLQRQLRASAAKRTLSFTWSGRYPALRTRHSWRSLARRQADGPAPSTPSVSWPRSTCSRKSSFAGKNWPPRSRTNSRTA
jgi:hypothetical protein